MRGWFYKTNLGIVSVRPRQSRWMICWNGEPVGSYHSPVSAADDAAMGIGLPLGVHGIPEDITEWRKF
jgi:hypothetical protein